MVASLRNGTLDAPGDERPGSRRVEPRGRGQGTEPREAHVRAILFDPELIGSFLNRTIGLFKKVEDFQEFRLWPILTVLCGIFFSRVLKRTVVIPMTISDLERWRYISGQFSRGVPQFISVRLVCSEATLRQRILSRPHKEGPHQWCLDHMEQGLLIMSTEEFGLAIQTDTVPPAVVADRILTLISTEG